MPRSPSQAFAWYAANPAHLQNVAQRFGRLVAKGAPDACWPWTGNTGAGYGRFKIESYVTVASHRLAYLIGHGVDPGPLLVCHRCDNPPCCNPDHLFLGTSEDNAADMVAKGRQRTAEQAGEHNGAAKLTGAQVEVIRDLIRSGLTNTAIAARFGVSHHNISRIRRGRAWGAEPMQPKYASLRQRRA